MTFDGSQMYNRDKSSVKWGYDRESDYYRDLYPEDTSGDIDSEGVIEDVREQDETP